MWLVHNTYCIQENFVDDLNSDKSRQGLILRNREFTGGTSENSFIHVKHPYNRYLLKEK